MSFVAFTQLPDSSPIHLRTNRIIAVAETPDGCRIFLAGGLTCEVTESVAEVIGAITPTDDAH